MTEKRLLALILGLFVLLGFTYALTTPVFEASDELWHYPMIRHLADGNPLPVQVFDPAQAGAWNQEASQPPLYYYLGAALTFWVDTADMETIRWLNPHVDNGVITEDGNRNLAIHDPQANPWRGTLLAVRIVRLASVLMGAGTVLLTYLIGKEVAPDRPEIALGAAAVTAFLPMFLFISGAVNNDNLAILLASLAVWMMIRSINSDPMIDYQTPKVWYWLLLGAVIGLAVLTKQGTFALLPLAWGTIFMVRWRVMGVKGGNGRFLSYSQLFKTLGHSVLYFALLLIPVVLIAGWWYWRNIQLYGDFLGWNAFIAVLGQRASPASLAQLWDERQGFMMAYWGLFGGVNIPMPLWIYRLLNGVLLASVAGFVLYFMQKIKDWRTRPELAEELKKSDWSWRFQSFISHLFSFIVFQFGLVVCLLFAGAVVFGLVQWATTTWSSQGRLVFTAISALSVLMIVGLVGWAPQKAARWIVGMLGTFMFVVAALAPWLWIQPAYKAPAYASPIDRSGAEFGGKLRLVGYELGETAVQPGDDLWLTLEWEALEPMERDWSVFVHLNDPVLGRPIAQRDMFPGQGLLATRLLQPGERIVNRYKLTVPATAIAPAALEVSVGLYDYASCPACERLPVTDAGLLPVNSDAVQVAILPLTAVAGAYPNPISVNFGDELELVGYEIKPRQSRPGDTIELKTYWRGKRPLSNNYTFFAQVVDLETTTRYGSQDIQPPAGPTSTWEPGQDYVVQMQLPLNAEIPASVYPIILGAYTHSPETGFERLQIVTADGRITQDDFLILTPVRIDN